MIGKLEKVALRKVWAKEDKNFTSWLEKNLDILSETIGIELSIIERERSAGAFSVDLFAEDSNGETVVIENQLEKTNHDHLGKVLTYLSNLDAKTAIWIASEPRPEHVTAINWLNEFSPSDISFFLVNVEAYRIGQSDPAALFTVVCRPSEEAKIIGQQKQKLAGRHLKRYEFWKRLLAKANQKSNLFGNVSPGKENWIYAGGGKAGLSWCYSILMDKNVVEFDIDFGLERKDETDRFYNSLEKQKEVIENKFGDRLIWDKLEGRRTCRIKSISELGGLKDEEEWDTIHDDMIDRMFRLVKALKPRLSQMR